jgi:LuxR family transcriptional regulator, maltose regulon positive regulatory protein
MIKEVSEASPSGKRGLRAVPVPISGAPTDVTIETKFHAPSQRKEWVERRELIQDLAGTAVKLVLVDAPAGFGKTALVAQWRASASEDRPFAWISLDESDDDPGRLWWHIVRALQRACPDLGGAELLQALRAQIPDLTGTVLPLLVNELAALSAPVILVLDDYHLVKDHRCHAQLAFLLLHLPSSAEIVLVTRTGPPLPLARLRAAGEMLEIRAPELRFAPAEATSLVRAVAGVELNDGDLSDLVERTEGWPAGVYLAALSLRGHPAPGAFIRQFTGGNRFIVDFLAEEVLSRQPDKTRQFLARTAILDRFCAPLCDAVAGSSNAAEIIEVLERENLFVVPLDDTRQWYRYHHLFAQVLRSELAGTEPDIMPSLHRRASAWHRQSGSADEAIRHALAGGDAAGAVELIAHHWYTYVDSGRAPTVCSWMRSLGDNAIAASPLAAHCAAWAAALTGDRGSLQRWLPLVAAGEYHGPLPDGMRSMQFSAALVQGTFGFDGIKPMREAAALAVSLEEDRASPWYALARTAAAFALYLSGALESAAAQAEEALLGNPAIAVVRMLAFAVKSMIAIEEGRLAEAQELANSAREFVTRGDVGLGEAPLNALGYAAAGAVHAAQGRLHEARSELEQALRPRLRWSGISPWPTVDILLRLTPVLLDLGDRSGAAARVEEVRQLLASSPDGAEAQRTRLDHLDRLIAGPSRAASLADPLTEREVAVLRLLRGTLSLREIGRELNLSQNTIKTHVQAIYRKLGVSTRPDAVETGRETGIL